MRKLSAPISLSTFRRFARYKLAKINLDFHYQVMHCFIPFQRGKDLYHLELQIIRWKNKLQVTQNNSCESLCESLRGTLRPLPSPPQPNENVHHTPVLIHQSWLPQQVVCFFSSVLTELIFSKSHIIVLVVFKVSCVPAIRSHYLLFIRRRCSSSSNLPQMVFSVQNIYSSSHLNQLIIHLFSCIPFVYSFIILVC